MAQRSQMVYCYFRFYVDTSNIESGLNQFCTSWEKMFEVGYNYIEYKCFVDNLGGLEHWVGDMQGYVSMTREVGFIDGSPSDAIFDQSLLMGSERVITDNILMLNGYKEGTKFHFRKISAQDAGIAHKVSFTCGAIQKIVHPVMYTLDHTQIEVIVQSEAGFVDNSDVDTYDVMVDASTKLLDAGTKVSHTGNLTNFENMFTGDLDDYAQLITTCPRDEADTIIVDMGATFSCVGVIVYNQYSGDHFSDTYIDYSKESGGGWVNFGHTGDTTGIFDYRVSKISGRYIRIRVYKHSGLPGLGRVHALMCS